MIARPPAVDGLFYPADAPRLRALLDELLGRATAVESPVPKVLIVPHAGYVYSGATAATAYRRLEVARGIVRRVVLLGPAHRVYLRAMALPTVDAFSTPLGDIPLDRDARDAIRGLPGVVENDEAHAREHSLEVQLPFLQRALDDFSLLPLVVGDCPADQVGALLDALWGGPETLFVISTDLSHFHSYERAEQIDQRTCERVLARASDIIGEEACGARPLNGLMRSRHAGTLGIELLARCNSGDRGGDRDKVVGYGAFALH